MDEHPFYGTEVTRERAAHLFGPPQLDGIAVCQGLARSILVKVGSSRTRYRNLLNRDELLYCWPDREDHRTRAMIASFASKNLIAVKIVPHGATQQFFWGNARIATLTTEGVTEFDHLGTPQLVDDGVKRFKLVRVGAAERETATTAGDDDRVARPDAATAAGQLVPEPPVKRSRFAARPVEAFNTRFDSLLEARHACVLTALGISWKRECLTVAGLDMRAASSAASFDATYTPDFLIVDPKRGTTILEIKPRYPYDVALFKCQSTCELLRLPVVLFYGTAFVAPFDAGARTELQYGHADGIRGMRWDWDATLSRAVCTHDVAYMAEDDGADGAIAFVDARTGPADARAYHARVAEAYEATTSIE